MNKYFASLVILQLLFQTSGAQHYRLNTTSSQETKEVNLMSHYKLLPDTTLSIFGVAEFSDADLFLYKNGKFVHRTYTCLAELISTGLWSTKGNVLLLKSEFGKTNLPVAVSYLRRSLEDSITKKVAIVKDLSGREYTSGAVIHINNDSVSCFWGDLECYGSYDSIESVKVSVGEHVSSEWFPVDQTKGIIQLTLQTDVDLHRYYPLNVRFRKEKNMLKKIVD